MDEKVSCRARAKDLVEVLKGILHKANNGGSWVTGLPNEAQTAIIGEETTLESDRHLQTTDCVSSHHTSASSIISGASSGTSSYLAVARQQNVSAVVEVPLISIEHFP